MLKLAISGLSSYHFQSPASPPAKGQMERVCWMAEIRNSCMLRLVVHPKKGPVVRHFKAFHIFNGTVIQPEKTVQWYQV